MIQAAAAILIQRGRVLICRRRPELRHAGKWEFPGGKVESGESPEMCLIREMKEELGIRVSVGDFFSETVYRYQRGPVHLLAYYVNWVAGEMVSEDHDRLEWVPPQHLKRYSLLPADLKFASKLTRTGRAGRS